MSARERSCCCATSDGALPKEDAVTIATIDTSKLGALPQEDAVTIRHIDATRLRGSDEIFVDGPVRIIPLDVTLLAGASSLDRAEGCEDVVERAVDESREFLDVNRISAVERCDRCVVPLDEFVGQGCVCGRERNRRAVAHDASPSVGESAEPGLASTASVEGETAAGGPFPGSPAADLRTALMKQADQLYSALAELRRTPEVIARIHAHRDALGLLTALPTSNATGHAVFYADAAIAAADAALAEASTQS